MVIRKRKDRSFEAEIRERLSRLEVLVTILILANLPQVAPYLMGSPVA